MSTSTLTRARNHYRAQQKVALAAVRAVRRAVKGSSSTTAASTAATTTLATYQLASAVNGARTMAAEAGRDLLSVPAAFAGTTQLGWPIETPIETILDRITREHEREVQRLTEAMLADLDLFVQAEVIAAGADASSVEITAGPEWTNYVRVLDLPSCDRCVILAGRIYRDLDGFPRHPRCFPAGTVVSGPGARGATRRWYEGELVVIRTAGGKNLSATANHPILTDKGWVPANLLAEGGYVVSRSRGDRSSALLVPDHDQMPARIEDLWRADSMTPLGRVPVAPEDFHGDGLGSSHVDVVLANGALRGGQQVAFLKELREELLALRSELSVALDSTRAADQLLLSHGLPALRAMGGLDLGNLLGSGHPTGAHQARLARMADRYPGLDQAVADYSAWSPQPVGDRVLALPSLVGRDNRGHVEVATAPDRARWDAPAAEFSMQTRAAYASVGNDLRTRLAGQEELDRIVETSRVKWSGHVYNLTSSEGWYDAEGIIVSNCDCQHWPVTSWAEAEAAGLVTDPMVAFERDQIKTRRWNDKLGAYELKNSLSVADMRAITDGADIQEVVNARRGGGRRPKGMTNAITAEIFGRTVKATTEGTTRRAAWRKKHPDLPIRLRPESIYEHATGRDDALRLLRLYGYIK